MPYIDKSELPDILRIAQRIRDHCIASGPSFDTEVDFSGGWIPGRTVKIVRGHGRIDERDQYSATSSIRLKIPVGGWIDLRISQLPVPPEVVVLITSAIAHELVHSRQDPADYRALAAEQSRYPSESGRSPREWFDQYYHSLLELEAHATQAAVALWTEASLRGDTPSPSADPGKTEAFRRPRERMGGPGEAGDPDIDRWWTDALNLARSDIAAFA